MKESNNKGFSLVELIIVVAILAILTGILAPAYIKYIDKSRRVVCGANIDEVETAWRVTLVEDGTKTLEAVLNELGPECPSGGNYSISVDGSLLSVICSVHGGEVTTGFEGTKTWAKRVYTSMLEFVGQSQEAIKAEIGKWVSNDNLMDYIRENTYGGSWPSFDEAVLTKNGISSSQYIKSYINLNNKKLDDTVAADVIVFANASETKGNWNTNLIYNPEDGQWYKGQKAFSIANKSWEEVHQMMKDNNWTPLEE